MGFTEKSDFYGGSRKTNIQGGGGGGGGCLKRGAWIVCRWGLGKKEGVVFLWGGLIPQCPLCTYAQLNNKLKLALHLQILKTNTKNKT